MQHSHESKHHLRLLGGKHFQTVLFLKYAIAIFACVSFFNSPALSSCDTVDRINDDWLANLARYRSEKYNHEQKPLNIQKENQCGADKSYVAYLQRALELVREYEAAVCPGKFKNFDCDSACFADRLQKANANLDKNCRSALQTASSPKSKASCGSTITGGNLPPAPKEQCANAKQLIKKARDVRKSWFGSKAKAEPLYKSASQAYRDAGDYNLSEFAIEESQAEDVTVYEQTQANAEQRPQNLKEAENLKGIARKIELGAYESKSCGDLLKAADYYFQSARLFLKTNEFKAADALLLRRDQLVAIVDDAKKRGACDGRVLVQRTPPPPPANEQPQADDGYCRKMAEFFARKENQKIGEIAAYKIDVALLCKGVVTIDSSDCLHSAIYWYEIKHTPEIRRKRSLVGCPVSQN